MNNLVDSSAWIAFFKGNDKFSFIKDLISQNALCTNNIILTELLPSIIHKKEHTLAQLLESLTNYTLSIDWQEICDIQLINFKHGNNNIGITDIIIVQNCLQNSLRLITNDKHFEAMAKYLKLIIYK